MSKELLETLDKTTKFLINIGLETPELELIKQVEDINREIKKRGGVTTDLDSTFFLSEEIAVDDFNRDNNTNYRVSDLTNRYAMVEWARALGVENPFDYTIRYWNNLQRLPHLPLTPGTKELFDYLYEVEMPNGKVTARPSSTAEATRMYFELNQPHVDLSYVFVQDQDRIDPKFKKKIVVEVFRAGVHFEDAQEEAEDIALEGVFVGLFPQPWNSGYKPQSPNIITLEQVTAQGLSVLKLGMEKFSQLPTMAKLYLAVGDKLLKISE